MPSPKDLRAAAARGSLASVRRHLAAGVDPDSADRYGMTPLLNAAQRGHVEVCRALLDAGANPNRGDAGGNTPLIVAVGHDQETIVRLLIERGADVNQRGYAGRVPLMNAVHGTRSVVQILLDAGADPFQKDDYGRDAVHEAQTFAGKRVQALLRRVAETRSTSANLDLHQAAGAGLLDVVQRHLQEGVDVNLLDSFGRTALMEAAKHGHLAIVEALLAGGADPHLLTHHDHHALCAAVSSDNPAIIRRLLEAALDGNVTVAAGLPPLMQAAAFGLAEAMRCLLEAGADPHRAAADGHTAATYARNSSRKLYRLFKQLTGAPADAVDAFYDDFKAVRSRAEEPAFVELAESLARRCGHRLYPWKKRKGVFRFWIRDRRRLARDLGLPLNTTRPELIERLQGEVRAAGYLLIIGDVVDPNPPLMLFPTSNQYAVILACGTNANRMVQEDGIEGFADAAYVARWLADLAKTHPWRLTECGFDFLGGRFDLPVRDAKELAQRLIAFCPDMLDDGPRNIAKELARTGRFFCWWD